MIKFIIFLYLSKTTEIISKVNIYYYTEIDFFDEEDFNHCYLKDYPSLSFLNFKQASPKTRTTPMITSPKRTYQGLHIDKITL